MPTSQDNLNRRGLPPGAFAWWCGNYNDIPVGFLLCDGAAVSRTTYADLFANIGTLHGVGDGSTTFNLPNLTERFIQGIATATTNAGATGGATSKTTPSGGGGPGNGGKQNSNRREQQAHTHDITDVRPKFLELVPVIST